MEKKPEQKAFSITMGSGFQIRFPNGYTVSVQFGPGNYCDNYGVNSYPNFTENVRKAGEDGSNTAETAILDPDWKFVRYPFDAPDVVQPPRMTPMEVLTLMNHVALLPPKKSVEG